ncbi:MAG: efflux RND transporter permease subunit, partial [Treponema sp.]|nr:efflux RND transporter permease subunit [Treponema sp.]
MKLLSSWLGRKKASLCILAGICAISLFAIINSGETVKQNTGGSYVVRIKHYGIDAAEMERSITIPLEDAFFQISGIMSVQSSSTNSLSSVFVHFKPGTKGRYEAIRDAAQRVYETLPSSAQRPEIFSSNNSLVPVWSASVFANNIDNRTMTDEVVLAAEMLENIVKPKLENLEGAGEVLVSGAGLKEIFIIFDQEKLSILGLDPMAAVSFLAMNDSIFSGGSIVTQNREIIISVDGRYNKTNSLENALIPIENGNVIRLSEIAIITEQEREPDIYSRLNGRRAASIAIMGKYGADLRKLSAEINHELNLLGLPLEFVVLSDLGAEEAAAYRSVFNAALLGAIMVALVSFLLNRKKHLVLSGFFCALAIPLICVISVAILSISGFTLDRLLLAGIAAGIGIAIDAVILCSERLRKCINYNSAAEALSSLAGPLLAGAATTVAALIPLTLVEDTSAKIIANAIIVVTITAFVLSLSLLPPLLLWNVNHSGIKSGLQTNNLLNTRRIFKRIGLGLSRQLSRILAATVRFSARCPIIILSISIMIVILAIFMLFAKGVDTGGFGSEDSVYAQVEFAGGLLAEEVDLLLADYSRQILNNAGIINIETGSRTGSGSLLISFDPKQKNTQSVRELAKSIAIPGGFIFFHENSIKDRYWRIFVYGDEDQKCRELAEELSFICANHSLVKDVVLNFKQGSKKMILTPNREIFAESNISFAAASFGARLGVYGPVIYKRIDSNGEIDVRARAANVDFLNHYMAHNTVERQSREGVFNILVSTGNEEINTSIHLGSLMSVQEETEPSSIRRNNRRRYASITISTNPMDPRRVKQQLLPFFDKLDLPPGYSIEFDPEAIKQSERLSATVLSLIMAIVFCYMIIAS